MDRTKKYDNNSEKQRKRVENNGVNDVSEIYSPPRVTAMAEKIGLRAGWALDLVEVDPEDGLPWDFSTQAKREKALRKIKTDKPFVLIASPMCGPFSALQSLFNYPKMRHEEVKKKLSDAMAHIEFCMELCREQHMNGRLFIFEHPAGAASWCMQAIQRMRLLEGVHVVKFDFCMLGMRATDRHGNPSSARKRTTVMTNSPAVATLLRDAQCRSEHQHTPLLGGKAGPCQEYTDQFCELICEGVRREKDTIKWRDDVAQKCQTNRCELLMASHQWRPEVHQVSDVSKAFSQLLAVQESIEKLTLPSWFPTERLKTPPEEAIDRLYDGVTFVDDVTGNVLNKKMAMAAPTK